MTTWTDVDLSFDGHKVPVAELSFDGHKVPVAELSWDGVRVPPSQLVHTTVEAVARVDVSMGDELLELCRRQFRAAAHAHLAGWVMCALCWAHAVPDKRLMVDLGLDYHGDGPGRPCFQCGRWTWSPVRIVQHVLHVEP